MEFANLENDFIQANIENVVDEIVPPPIKDLKIYSNKEVASLKLPKFKVWSLQELCCETIGKNNSLTYSIFH